MVLPGSSAIPAPPNPVMLSPSIVQPGAANGQAIGGGTVDLRTVELDEDRRDVGLLVVEDVERLEL